MHRQWVDIESPANEFARRTRPIHCWILGTNNVNIRVSANEFGTVFLFVRRKVYQDVVSDHCEQYPPIKLKLKRLLINLTISALQVPLFVMLILHCDYHLNLYHDDGHYHYHHHHHHFVHVCFVTTCKMFHDADVRDYFHYVRQKTCSPSSFTSTSASATRTPTRRCFF